MRKLAVVLAGVSAVLASPAPAIPACVVGPFFVFFDSDRDDIRLQSQAVLDSAVSAYQICPQPEVVITGHADRSGSEQYNLRLSQRRAANIRAYLAGRGIPEDVLSTEALGESRTQIDTPDGAREPLNRRVEITFRTGQLVRTDGK